MRLDELKTLLSTKATFDVDEIYQHFLEGEAHASTQSFVAYLEERALIEPEVLAELRALIENPSQGPETVGHDARAWSDQTAVKDSSDAIPALRVEEPAVLAVDVAPEQEVRAVDVEQSLEVPQGSEASIPASPKPDEVSGPSTLPSTPAVSATGRQKKPSVIDLITESAAGLEVPAFTRLESKITPASLVRPSPPIATPRIARAPMPSSAELRTIKAKDPADIAAALEAAGIDPAESSLAQGVKPASASSEALPHPPTPEELAQLPAAIAQLADSPFSMHDTLNVLPDSESNIDDFVMDSTLSASPEALPEQNSGTTPRSLGTADTMDVPAFADIAKQLTSSTHNALQIEEKYKLIESIGAGAMGSVFVAKDLRLRRKVALKRLHAKLTSRKQMKRRFLRESQITAQLDHPNIVPVYSLERDPHSGNEVVGYTMKWVRGKNMATLIAETRTLHRQKKPINDEHDVATRLEHFLKVCDALAYAHSKGVLHRDLKPANIMIGGYHEVYVMDWGIARLMEKRKRTEDQENTVELDVGAKAAEQQLELTNQDGKSVGAEFTQAGQLLGTPGYMSPEQARGLHHELDQRSDLYALGLILYELITLRPGYTSDNAATLLFKVIASEYHPIQHSFGEPIPTPLKAIIKKALEKEPAERYDNVSALAEDLRLFLRGEAVSAHQESTFRRARRWIAERHFLRYALLIFVFLGVAGSFFGIYWRQEQRALAMKRAAKEQARFVQNVAQHVAQVQLKFLAVERQLEGIAEATQQAILDGVANKKARFFWGRDFNNPKRQPPDLTRSPLFRDAISPGWPVWHHKAGLKKKDLRRDVQSLATLRHVFRRAILKSVGRRYLLRKKKRMDRALLYKRRAWRSVALGLERGLTMIYPGRAGLPPHLNVRTEMWFRRAFDKRTERSLHCGNWSSRTRVKRGVLSCSRVLRDHNHYVLGVLSVGLSRAYIAQRWMGTQLPNVTRSVLLSRQGQVLLESDGPGRLRHFSKTKAKQRSPENSVKKNQGAGPRFRNPLIYKAHQAQKLQVVSRGVGRGFWIVVPLPAFRWSYVLQVKRFPSESL